MILLLSFTGERQLQKKSQHTLSYFDLPISKRSLLYNSLFYKAPLLWNSLPQHIKLSCSFSAFIIHFTRFNHEKKHNTWHLNGSNRSVTSLRSILCLGHSLLNINLKSFCQCSRGFKETLEHRILQCKLSLHYRNILFRTLKKTILNEKKLSSFTILCS